MTVAVQIAPAELERLAKGLDPKLAPVFQAIAEGQRPSASDLAQIVRPNGRRAAPPGDRLEHGRQLRVQPLFEPFELGRRDLDGHRHCTAHCRTSASQRAPKRARAPRPSPTRAAISQRLRAAARARRTKATMLPRTADRREDRMAEETFELLIGEPFHARYAPEAGELRLGGTGYLGGEEKRVELVVPGSALRQYRDHLRALLRALETADLPASTTTRRQ